MGSASALEINENEDEEKKKATVQQEEGPEAPDVKKTDKVITTHVELTS